MPRTTKGCGTAGAPVQEAAEEDFDEVQAASDWAKEFVALVVLDLENIPESDGTMQIMRDVMDLERGIKQTGHHYHRCTVPAKSFLECVHGICE